MTEKKANHQVNIVRITDISKHPNADSLDIIRLEGYQVVSKTGQFKAGDLGVYVQPDSVVPQTEPFRFIWEAYQTDPDGAVPEKRRRITVRKFRGEWSEGLLLPLSDFNTTLPVPLDEYREGDDVSDVLGVKHYDPDTNFQHNAGDTISGPRRKYPKTFKGWFFFLLQALGFKKAGQQLHEEVSFQIPVYDVEAYKKHINTFLPGELVVVTEKIHGSNARFVFIDGKMYAGSRTLWKAPKSNCIWRRALEQCPWIEEWCRANEGYALYGEVVPTQKGFDYGYKPGEVGFFPFDILDPNGEWLSKDEYTPEMWQPLANHWVPRILEGTAIEENGLNAANPEVLKKLVDGPSLVRGAKHIREGIVVTPWHDRRIPGLGRVILKLVSNSFLEKDLKATAAA